MFTFASSRIFWLEFIVFCAAVCVACSTKGPPFVPSEYILFTSIGNRPFQDSVSAIGADGSNLKRLLPPSASQSYLYASGNSLRTPLVVAVHQLSSEGTVVDNILRYDPLAKSWEALLSDTFGAAGYLSPDGKKVAFLKGAPSQPGALRIWLKDLQTSEIRSLTAEEGQFWDGYINWSRDSQNLLFLRLHRTSAGISTVLMRKSLSNDAASVVLDSEETVMAACYSPDATRVAILSVKGLEVIRLADSTRTLILSWSQLPNPQFRTGGLVWSPLSDRLAFAMFDTKKSQSALWTVSSEGKDLTKIYSQSESDGYLIACSFLEA